MPVYPWSGEVYLNSIRGVAKKDAQNQVRVKHAKNQLKMFTYSASICYGTDGTVLDHLTERQLQTKRPETRVPVSRWNKRTVGDIGLCETRGRENNYQG